MNTLNVTVHIDSKKPQVWTYKKVKGGEIKYNKNGDAILFVCDHENEKGERITAYIPFHWIRHMDYGREDEDGS